MRDAGIPIRINSYYAIMHDKYMVIDGKTVETGSFNYTRPPVLRSGTPRTWLSSKTIRRWLGSILRTGKGCGVSQNEG